MSHVATCLSSTEHHFETQYSTAGNQCFMEFTSSYNRKIQQYEANEKLPAGEDQGLWLQELPVHCKKGKIVLTQFGYLSFLLSECIYC